MTLLTKGKQMWRPVVYFEIYVSPFIDGGNLAMGSRWKYQAIALESRHGIKRHISHGAGCEITNGQEQLATE